MDGLLCWGLLIDALCLLSFLLEGFLEQHLVFLLVDWLCLSLNYWFILGLDGGVLLGCTSISAAAPDAPAGMAWILGREGGS